MLFILHAQATNLVEKQLFQLVQRINTRIPKSNVYDNKIMAMAKTKTKKYQERH